MSRSDFWAIAPGDFDIYFKIWEQKQERENRRSALTATILSNIYRKKGSPKIDIEAFLPEKRKARDEERDPVLEQQTLASLLNAMAHQSKPRNGNEVTPLH